MNTAWVAALNAGEKDAPCPVGGVTASKVPRPGQVTVSVPPGTSGAASAAGLATRETAAAADPAAHSMESRRRLIDMASPRGTVPHRYGARPSNVRPRSLRD